LRNSNQKESQKDLLLAAGLGYVLCGVALWIIKDAFADSGRGFIQRTLDFLYPFFDIAEIILMLMLIRLAMRSHDSNRIKAYIIFCSAFLLLVLGDLATTTVRFESMLYRGVDVVYFSSYFQIAISGIFLARSRQTAGVLY
jgi:hypothetical protein